MSARLMNCSACGHGWETPAVAPSGPFSCPNCGGHVCACGCGAELWNLRAHSRYRTAACRTALERADFGTTRAAKAHKSQTQGSVHPLADARASQEASELKSHWSQVIYQGIVDRLKHGPVHADDLEPLFPANEEERAMCRKLVGAQFGSLASRKYIVEKERRKSTVPTRKGAKSGVFVFTPLGREKLVGIHAGVPGPQGSGEGTVRPFARASVDSGESPAGADTENREGSALSIAALDRPDAPSHAGAVAAPTGARSSLGVDPGGQGSPVHGRQRAHDAGEPRPTSEAVPLFEEEKRTHSAVTEPEMGEAA